MSIPPGSEHKEILRKLAALREFSERLTGDPNSALVGLGFLEGYEAAQRDADDRIGSTLGYDGDVF